jgi:hypothetical protein
MREKLPAGEAAAIVSGAQGVQLNAAATEALAWLEGNPAG